MLPYETEELLKDVDIMLFDLQDVGARFYTYISTLHYVMEACAENNIPLYFSNFLSLAIILSFLITWTFTLKYFKKW